MIKILFFLLALLPTALRAEVDIVPLRQRTVQQVLPVLRPVVETGAFVQSALARGSGMVSFADAQRQQSRRVWVKVEELR